MLKVLILSKHTICVLCFFVIQFFLRNWGFALPSFQVTFSPLAPSGIPSVKFKITTFKVLCQVGVAHPAVDSLNSLRKTTDLSTGFFNWFQNALKTSYKQHFIQLRKIGKLNGKPKPKTDQITYQYAYIWLILSTSLPPIWSFFYSSGVNPTHSIHRI